MTIYDSLLDVARVGALRSDVSSPNDPGWVQGFFDAVSDVDGVALLFLVGLAVLLIIPCLAVVGFLYRSANRAEAAPASGDTSVSNPGVAPVSATGLSNKPDGPGGANPSSQTLISPPVASRDDVGPRRLTTQALRSPPRSGRARILVMDDGCAGSGKGSDRSAGGPVDADDVTGRTAPNPAGSKLEVSTGGVRDDNGRLGDAQPDVYVFAKGDMLRIGRESDNDIVLRSQTVHRYHAVVRRTRDAGYVLMDLSGAGGNGIQLNGERILDAQLRSGDKIVLGMAQLKFIIDR
ncbi:MAG: FHA domain-containing protein [Pseudomonadota bacterium]